MTSPAAVALSVLAAYGVYLLYTAFALGWRGLGAGPAVSARRTHRHRTAAWRAAAGLGDVRPAELVSVAAVLFAVGSGVAYALFGGAAAPLCVGCASSYVPVAAARSRHTRRRAAARDAWPRMIEELRLLTVSAGRSIPQALLEVGRRAPRELRPGFDAAQREWLMTTDFERTVAVLKAQLADATADTVCETLLIAHEMGGTEVGQRLAALVEDRTHDLQGRKDAAAKQAGARFARAFVVVVPAGMALVGLTIGDGRAAYATAGGQAAVVTALAMMSLCWWWAGRIMRLPDEQRVFGASTDSETHAAAARTGP